MDPLKPRFTKWQEGWIISFVVIIALVLLTTVTVALFNPTLFSSIFQLSDRPVATASLHPTAKPTPAPTPPVVAPTPPSATPSPSPSETPSPTPTPSPSPSPSPSPTPPVFTPQPAPLPPVLPTDPTPAPVPPEESQSVVLTFDDCPYGVSLKKTNATLDAAQKMGMHLRLYVVGECLQYHWFDAQKARGYGHMVCSHSFDHADLRTLPSVEAIKKDLLLTRPDGKLLLKTDCGRPPYGATNAMVEEAFKQLGYRLDLWTLDTNDWEKGVTQKQVIAKVITDAKPGDVVLMHMNHAAFNAESLRAIQQGLLARGITVQ